MSTQGPPPAAKQTSTAVQRATRMPGITGIQLTAEKRLTQLRLTSSPATTLAMPGAEQQRTPWTLSKTVAVDQTLQDLAQRKQAVEGAGHTQRPSQPSTHGPPSLSSLTAR